MNDTRVTGFWFGAVLLLMLCGTGFTLLAAEWDSPVHGIDGSFIRDWLVLGPFPSREIETDFLAANGGEASIRPKEGDVVTSSDGTALRWTRLRSDFNIVNLEKVFGIRSWSVAYAYCEISSDRGIETDLQLPVEGASLCWLNGRKIESSSIRIDTFRRSSIAGPVQVTKGVNSCLLKLRMDEVNSREWTFSLQLLPPERVPVEVRVTDGNNEPVPGAVVQLYDQGEIVGSAITDALGGARTWLFPLAKVYDLRVTSGETGAWLYDLAFQPGGRRELNVVLERVVSISGQVLAPDDSPLNAIVVQALRVSDSENSAQSDLALGGDVAKLASTVENSGVRVEGSSRLVQSVESASNGQLRVGENLKARSLIPMPPFSETVLSDTSGTFRFVNLRPGTYRLRCHGLGEFIAPVRDSGEPVSMPVIVAVGRTNKPVRFMFANPKKGVWKSYSITKGLMNLSPVSIHRTQDGLLWVGTGSGTVHSYDGVDFRLFQAPQIPGLLVRTIHHDSAGTVWVGTDGGITRSVDGKFQPLDLGGTLLRRQIWNISADPDGSMWFATSSGLGRYGGGKYSSWGVAEGLPMNGVNGLLRARGGAVWMGTGVGLAKFEGGNVSIPLVISAPRVVSVGHLHESKDNAIWYLGTFPLAGKAYRFDGATLRFLGMEEGLLSEHMTAIAETADGDLWFGSRGGLSRFDGTTIVNYTPQDGVGNPWVNDIFVDEDDVLWVTHGEGVSRFDPNGFSGFDSRDGLQAGGRGGRPAVFTIEPDLEDGYLVGTEWGGAYRINQRKGRASVMPIAPRTGYIRQMKRDQNGTLWLGTSSGLDRLVDGAMNRVLERSWVVALSGDKRGRFWYGQGWIGGGVSRYNPATGAEDVFTKEHGLPDDSVWAIDASREGDVWIGTGAGLVRCSGDTLVDETGRLGLPTAPVYSLRYDGSGTLWISTGQGLHSWNGTNTFSITAADGLPDENVFCSAQTGDGIIWIGTVSNGLIGYDGRAMTVLDKRDGLLGNQVFTIAPDGDRALWMGFLEGGLTRYERKRSRPSIRLLEASTSDQPATDSSSLLRTEISHRVEVRYQEIDLKTHPEKRQFYYRVTNASGQTVLAGVTKERRFEWKPSVAGDYHFNVQAIDRDLNYSEPAGVRMRVTVPWHSNVWVLTPSVLAFGGLVIWAFVARTLYQRQIREAALLRERVRIARDLHDHLGAGLTHLAMVGDLVRQQAAQPGAVELLASRLTQSARELTRTMGEIIWATDPEKDTLRSFALFISGYAERFFAESAIRLRFDVPEEISDQALPTEHRSVLFAVTKEALNNVAKHAKASELWIKLEVSDRELSLRIEDDGHGFMLSHVAEERHGLVNMKQRLLDLGVELVIESAPGEGTRILARLPLPGR